MNARHIDELHVAESSFENWIMHEGTPRVSDCICEKRYGAKIAKGNKYSFVTSNRKENLYKLLDYIEPDDYCYDYYTNTGSVTGEKVDFCDKRIEALTDTGIEDIFLKINSKLSNMDPNKFIVQISRQVLKYSGYLDRCEPLSYKKASLSMTVEEISEGSDQKRRVKAKKTVGDMDLLDYACAGLAESIRLKKSRVCSRNVKGRYSIVFSPEVSYQLIKKVLDELKLSSIRNEDSPYYNALDKQVFSSGIFIYDMPLLMKSLGSYSFDYEFITPKSVYNVIKKGILTEPISNAKTAYESGVRSTGHAQEGISGESVIKYSNIIMDLGTYTVLNYDSEKYVIVNEVSHLQVTDYRKMELKMMLRICTVVENDSESIYINIPCTINLIDFAKSIVPLSSFSIVKGVKFPFTMLDRRLEFSSSGGEVAI
ncbi:MAG: hypothetical protein GXZ01_06475 [Clostridiaceae bacterium]|nr:hypothetical protein [Clostridiaceae bacterium]